MFHGRGQEGCGGLTFLGLRIHHTYLYLLGGQVITTKMNKWKVSLVIKMVQERPSDS
jgi:hypothetical protein